MTSKKSIVLVLTILLQAVIAGNTMAQDTIKSHTHHTDTTIYQGTFLKIDAFTPIYEVARSKGKLQEYELGVNVRLQDRFFPTIEGGYAFGNAIKDSVEDKINGGYMRFGLDINPLKKNRRSPNSMLVGIRIGSSFQQKCDVWGEVVIGCQVHIVSGFYMGWMARVKMLFTNRNATYETAPIFISGYGYRDTAAWGANYYFGWRF